MHVAGFLARIVTRLANAAAHFLTRARIDVDYMQFAGKDRGRGPRGVPVEVAVGIRRPSVKEIHMPVVIGLQERRRVVDGIVELVSPNEALPPQLLVLDQVHGPLLSVPPSPSFAQGQHGTKLLGAMPRAVRLRQQCGPQLSQRAALPVLRSASGSRGSGGPTSSARADRGCGAAPCQGRSRSPTP